jgi:hypothetical protein
MPVTCDACLKVLGDDRITRDAQLQEHAVLPEAKYVEIDAVLGRVHEDLKYRSRLGLARHLHRIQTWFRFHGPWLPLLPPVARNAEPKSTRESYAYAAEFCDFLAQKSWADELHVEACEAGRELPREMVRMGAR